MQLVEHVHYEDVELIPGHFVYSPKGEPAWGYCYDAFDGRARVLRITHPDVDSQDIVRLGDHMRTMRIVRNQKIKRKTLEKQNGKE